MTDAGLEVCDQRGVHLGCRGKRALAEVDDAMMAEVQVGRIPVGQVHALRFRLNPFQTLACDGTKAEVLFLCSAGFPMLFETFVAPPMSNVKSPSDIPRVM